MGGSPKPALSMMVLLLYLSGRVLSSAFVHHEVNVTTKDVSDLDTMTMSAIAATFEDGNLSAVPEARRLTKRALQELSKNGELQGSDTSVGLLTTLMYLEGLEELGNPMRGTQSEAKKNLLISRHPDPDLYDNAAKPILAEGKLTYPDGTVAKIIVPKPDPFLTTRRDAAYDEACCIRAFGRCTRVYTQWDGKMHSAKTHYQCAQEVKSRCKGVHHHLPLCAD